MPCVTTALVLAAAAAHGAGQAQGEYAPLPEDIVFGAPASPEDAGAVADLMRRFSRAWASQDVEAVLATYAEDAEWVNAFGLVARGHEELRERFTWLVERFPAPDPDRAREPERADDPDAPVPGRLSLRWVGAGVAVVHGVTESDWGESRDGAGLRRVHITYVLEKRAGGWRIAHQMIMDARR